MATPTTNPIPGLILPALSAVPRNNLVTSAGLMTRAQSGVAPGTQQSSSPMQQAAGPSGGPLITDPSVARALQKIQQHAKSISPRMLFVDGVGLVNGLTPPDPPSDAYLIGGGTQAVTFTSGNAPVTFPTTFPNDLLWIIPWHPSAAGNDTFSFSAPTLGGFTLHSSVGGSGGATIGYTVLGW